MSEELFTVEDRREKGFYQIDNELVTVYAPKIKANGIAVYNALVYHANNKKPGVVQECWPSQNTLAKESGMCRSAVIKALEKLEEHGLIKIVSGRYDELAKANEQNKYILLPLKDRGICTPCVSNTQPPCIPDTQGVVRETHNPSTLNIQELDPINYTHDNNTKSVVETTPPIPIAQSETIVKKARTPKSTYPKPPKQDNPYLENEGVQAYQKVFKKPPDIDQSLEIVTRVTDATRFESVCHEWKLNGWRAKSVASMIDRYEKQGALIDGSTRFSGTGYNGRSTLVGNGSRTFNKAQGGSGPGGRYTKAELDDDLGGSNHRKNRPIVAGTAYS